MSSDFSSLKLKMEDDMQKVMDAYIRVSQVGGRDKKNGGDSFGSPDDQEKAIRELAARSKVTIAEVVTELDVSGGKAAQERELERLVQRCEAGESTGIIVLSCDRFTREHPYEAPATLARLRRCRCRLLPHRQPEIPCMGIRCASQFD